MTSDNDVFATRDDPYALTDRPGAVGYPHRGPARDR